MSDVMRPGTIVVNIDVVQIWKKEKFRKKVKSLFKLGYKPSEHLISETLSSLLYEDYFGEYLDSSEVIREVLNWHYSRICDLKNLNPTDQEYAHGIESSGALTRLKIKSLKNNHKYNLSLFAEHPMICLLIPPLVAKFPVRSIKNHLDFDFYFAFSEIRNSEHPCADELIRLIYDLFLTQHKITFSRIELLENLRKSEQSDSQLSFHDANAVRTFDILISYLKATIEKATSLLGLTYEIKDLDAKKNHNSRINSLKIKIPEKVKQQYYWDFIMSQLDPEKLTPLNNLRTGILHKKGITKTQPHSIINDKENNNLKEFYEFITRQHTDNTAMLICIFAILTDKLVELKQPSFHFTEIPITQQLEYIKLIEIESDLNNQ